MRKTQSLSRALLILSLVSLVPHPSFADDEKSSQQSGFVLVDEDIEKVNQKLIEAESELLARLEKEQAMLEASAKELEKTNVSFESPAKTLQITDPVRRDLDSAVEQESDEGLTRASLKSEMRLAEEDSTQEEPESPKGSDEFDSLKQKHESLQAKLRTQESSLSKLRNTKAKVEQKLSSTEQQVTKLLKELEDTRNRLIIAETEVERLSSIIERRTSKDLGSVAPAPKTRASLDYARTKPISGAPSKLREANDMVVATVSVTRANLRTGPGKNNSPLMTVAQGTRLAVETRKGDWYRVIAPTGARAWIASEVVSFGKTRSGSPSGSVSIQGYSADDERPYQVRKQTPFQ